MHFHILGYFPDVFDPYYSQSLLGKAREKGLVSFFYHQVRDWAKNEYGQVDDKPYGGGSGMVLLSEVLCAAVRQIKTQNKTSRVVLTSPSGPLFSSQTARRLSEQDSILWVCGRYEGIDQRAVDLVVDEEISIGDYVLSGGELASCVMIDAICRYIPGVVGKTESVENDSHESGLLEHPHYTRPEIFEGLKVPDILLRGNHKKIEEWRHEESLKRTRKRRPDLLMTKDHGPKSKV